MKRWWSNKYKLPPTHKLFVEQSLADIRLEFYEDMFLKKQEIEEELKDGRISDKPELMTQLRSINNVLGVEDEHSDPLVDQWDKEFEEGRIPDLDAS